MLYTDATPGERRRALRERLASGDLLQMPGAFNPLAARLIEAKGFDGVYVSGAVISADLGLPDIGLTTATEVATRAGQIARMTSLPTLVDADTGFGEPMNVARTVQALEDAGVAGCHIEDQVNPKRCGHLDGKQVVDLDTAVQRVRAAVAGRRDPDFLVMARTDVRAVEGLPAAIDVPLLANMTEFGKGELLTAEQLADLGYNLVIYPVTLLRLAMGAAAAGLDEIRGHGTQAALLDRMQHRRDLYELVDYTGYDAFDTEIDHFRL